MDVGEPLSDPVDCAAGLDPISQLRATQEVGGHADGGDRQLFFAAVVKREAQRNIGERREDAAMCNIDIVHMLRRYPAADGRRVRFALQEIGTSEVKESRRKARGDKAIWNPKLVLPHHLAAFWRGLTAQPFVERVVEMAEFCFLIAGKNDLTLGMAAQALLHCGVIESVLIENLVQI